MGVYSNIQIKQAIKDGHIVFHPYVEEHIAGSSVDVTLGNWFYRTERPSQGGFYNPFDEKAVNQYFGDSPFEAEIHHEWAEKHGRKLFTNIPADHPIIVLRPGERILAHTHEFIGIKAPGTSTMQARSTWGRNGVAVCLDAGWGDPGYINRWTMEIYNMNQHESVVLPVGERIAQLVFYETGPVDQEYKKLSGKYQPGKSDDLNAIIANWKPQQMLPKAYNDKRRAPGAIEDPPKNNLHPSGQPFLARTVPDSVDLPMGSSSSPETDLTQKSSDHNDTSYPKEGPGGLKVL